MGDNSNIQWTDAKWNPVVGCTKVSAGCQNCYAMKDAARIAHAARAAVLGGVGVTPVQRAYMDVVKTRDGVPLPQWNNTVRCVPERIIDPLRWKKPRMIFVNSMSDLFHHSVPDSYIRLVFAAMSYCGQHKFQILTKRPERMAAWFADEENCLAACQAEWLVEGLDDKTPTGKHRIGRKGSGGAINGTRKGVGDGNYWPLPNVWIGTSVEHQAAADERVPHLLRCPAAVRFLSAEPLLGPVDLHKAGWTIAGTDMAQVQWVIAGGESGAHARPCDVAWIRAIVDQCRGLRVPCFVKQLGSRPWADLYTRDHEWHEWSRENERCVWNPNGLGEIGGCEGVSKWRPCDGQPRPGAMIEVRLRHSKGGEPAEWPQDLRVRQMPEVRL